MGYTMYDVGYRKRQGLRISKTRVKSEGIGTNHYELGTTRF